MLHASTKVNINAELRRLAVGQTIRRRGINAGIHTVTNLAREVVILCSSVSPLVHTRPLHATELLQWSVPVEKKNPSEEKKHWLFGEESRHDDRECHFARAPLRCFLAAWGRQMTLQISTLPAAQILSAMLGPVALAQNENAWKNLEQPNKWRQLSKLKSTVQMVTARHGKSLTRCSCSIAVTQ